MDLSSTPYVQEHMKQSAPGKVEATPNHGQTPSPVGTEPQMAMECTSDSSGATTGPRRHPTTMGFEQLLDLECTPPTAGPGESKDEA